MVAPETRSSSGKSDTSTGSDTSTLRYIKLDEHKAPGVATKADFCIRGRLYLGAQVSATGNTHQGFAFDQKTGTIQSSYCVGAPYHCLAVGHASASGGSSGGSGSGSAHGGPCSGKDAEWTRTYA